QDSGSNCACCNAFGMCRVGPVRTLPDTRWLPRLARRRKPSQYCRRVTHGCGELARRLKRCLRSVRKDEPLAFRAEPAVQSLSGLSACWVLPEQRAAAGAQLGRELRVESGRADG